MVTIIDCETTGTSPVSKIMMDEKNYVRKHNVISCIAFKEAGANTSKVFAGLDEKQILIDVFNEIQSEIEFVGFNLGFDLNFIKTRAFFHGLKIPANILIAKRIDIMRTISEEQFPAGNLDFWAEVVGFKAETENGSKMPLYYQQRKFDLISAHCQEDIIKTEKLYFRCKECGLI